MPVVEPIKKRIEFVGDSITCGFGLGTSEKDRFYYPQEENVWMAHGPTAARYLGMDWQMICISGICLAPRKEIPMPVAMNMLYEYTDWPAQQALELDADHWNFKEHPVDYVVINLGTNDATAASFSAAPKKIEEQYEKDYVHFLKTVRKCNGDKTKIICALGSMDYYFYDAMNRAVDTYRAETGDNNVYTFKYCRMSPMDPIGACGHPSELTQQKMAKELAKHGVTSFCPTSMTLPKERLESIVETIKEFKKESHGGAKVTGINLEGPFIAMSKKGAQNAEYVRGGTIEEFDDLYAKSGKLVKLITIAPEAFDSEKFIKHAKDYANVSIGHSAANADECKKAIDCGISHATHLFNAMTPMAHREAGIAGTVLDDETAEAAKINLLAVYHGRLYAIHESFDNL